MLTDGTTTAVEVLWSGTQTGPMDVGGGNEFPASGLPFTTWATMWTRWEDGKAARSATTWTCSACSPRSARCARRVPHSPAATPRRTSRDEIGPEPMAGALVHLCLRRPEGGLRYIDVWESAQAHSTALTERIGPAVEAVIGRRPGGADPSPAPLEVVHAAGALLADAGWYRGHAGPAPGSAEPTTTSAGSTRPGGAPTVDDLDPLGRPGFRFP